MSRPLKFRAWDKKRKLYRLVRQLDIDWDGVSYTTDTNNHDPAWDVNEDLIFEQHTGLKDKNGVEIYEGDIVKCQPTSPVKFIGVVEFHNGCFGVKFADGSFRANTAINNIGEVVGNIHESNMEESCLKE